MVGVFVCGWTGDVIACLYFIAVAKDRETIFMLHSDHELRLQLKMASS